MALPKEAKHRVEWRCFSFRPGSPFHAHALAGERQMRMGGILCRDTEREKERARESDEEGEREAEAQVGKEGRDKWV